MIKPTFENDETYLPITMVQFETLANEILTEINKLVTPHFLTGDYVAQIMMSAIHSMPHTIGTVKKSELFDSCVDQIFKSRFIPLC